MTVRAVVFDFDGLILDTESSIYASWCRVFEEHDCAPPSLEEWAAEVGTARRLEIVEMLQSRAGVAVEIDALQERRRAHRDELLASEVVLAGVVDWLDAAQARGLGLAVASSSEHEWVDAHLTRLGLRERFACLACHGDGLRAKPDAAIPISTRARPLVSHPVTQSRSRTPSTVLSPLAPRACGSSRCRMA